jgi:hypothetical protein
VLLKPIIIKLTNTSRWDPLEPLDIRSVHFFDVVIMCDITYMVDEILLLLVII